MPPGWAVKWSDAMQGGPVGAAGNPLAAMHVANFLHAVAFAALALIAFLVPVPGIFILAPPIPGSLQRVPVLVGLAGDSEPRPAKFDLQAL